MRRWLVILLLHLAVSLALHTLVLEARLLLFLPHRPLLLALLLRPGCLGRRCVVLLLRRPTLRCPLMRRLLRWRRVLWQRRRQRHTAAEGRAAACARGAPLLLQRLPLTPGR